MPQMRFNALEVLSIENEENRKVDNDIATESYRFHHHSTFTEDLEESPLIKKQEKKGRTITYVAYTLT